MCNISLIASIDLNNAIGNDDDLLIKIPADLKRFKKLTTGNTVLMGRNTFDSIGGELPNRKNVVATKSKTMSSNITSKYPNIKVVSDLDDYLLKYEGDDLFVIGGGDIFEAAMRYADNLYITKIHHRFKNTDTYFPTIKHDKWTLESYEHNKIYTDRKTGKHYTYSYLNYCK